MGVHLHSRSHSDSDDEHHHVSIAKLRSKFETLAHGGKHGHLSSNGREPKPAPHRETGQSSEGTAATKHDGGQATTAGAAKVAPTVPSKPSLRPTHSPEELAPLQDRSASPSLASQPVPIPGRAKTPVAVSVSSASATPIYAAYAKSPAPETDDLKPQPSKVAQGQTPPPPSFNELRDRFKQATAAPPAAAPSPSRSRRPSVEALLQKTGQVEMAKPEISSRPPPPAPPSKPAAAAALPVPIPTARSSASTSPLSKSPVGARVAPTTSRKPPPPLPRSRGASPAPGALPASTSSLMLSASPGTLTPRPASPASSLRAPPPSLPIRTQSPQPTEAVDAPAIPKPPLPVRKHTLSTSGSDVTALGPPPPIPGNRPKATPDEMPSELVPPARPPLPANKPLAPTSLPAVALAALAVSAPADTSKPRLPQRPRGDSIAQPEGITSPPPPLPVRHGDSAGSPPRRDRAPSVSAVMGETLPPPPKRKDSLQAPPPRRGTITMAGPLHHPSPHRGANGTSSAGLSTPPPKRGASGDSDDDEDVGAAQLTTMAQRLLEEHPDSTEANRRAPTFSPDICVTTSQSITAFAVWGRYACVAHYSIKVYDTLMGNTPILQIDQKDAGLELRSKEPRITALGFRSSRAPENEGRYLWCGNKDGHLFEVDIKSGAVTATKPFVHASPITHIMRYQRRMITLDDSGKMHVWDSEATGDATHEGGTFKSIRTLRVSDKITFAKMVHGKLWTATAPAVRSTTNTSSARGPTVRVYDPCAAGLAPPPLTAITTEWTGAATCATMLMLGGDRVYIGHEGGYVSIWQATGELHCLQVLKVSTTDILALEGAGKHLWAGNRRGQIHVWNLETKPWRTSNIWTAHEEQPIVTLVADPYGTEATGRFSVWSMSRDQLHAWDGLRGVNWIDKRMVERQPDYCDFRQVRVLVVSWNIDSAKPTDLHGSPHNVQFLEEVLNSVESPDIIVFGFQEVIPLTDKSLTAKTLLFGSKGKGGGGATNERVSGAYRAWADKLSIAVRQFSQGETSYVKVQSEQLVGLFSCMFVKSSEKDSLRDVNITTVKRGIGGIYGNKGAIVARMVVDDTSMCFINVHLAAGQRHKAARNADVAAIMEDKVVFPPADKLPYVHGGDGTGILDHEMVVLNGDLNYRIDQRREVVESSIQAMDLAFLLEHDQLGHEMKTNHAFRLRSFSEAPITFPPTYKYDPGTDHYDSSDKRRIPAWCDRVLYTKTPRIVPLNYRRYECNVSDHRPVSAALGVQIKRIDPVRMRDVKREVQNDWAKLESERLAVILEVYKELL